MRIGEVARRTGMGESALRAWERRFRLLEPERSSGGQRRYSEADVERVLTVRRLVAEGFTLPTAAARVRGDDGVLPAPAGGDDRLEQILQAVPEGIWVGHGGVITYANRRMLEMLG